MYHIWIIYCKVYRLSLHPSFPPSLGKEAHDLPFVKGEVLTIIEPCNVVFWYLAENKKGQRGIIPITHVKVRVGGGW